MISDDLKAARALIEKPGTWCTGKRDNGKGAHCAYGALDACTSQKWRENWRDDRNRCADALATVLERRFRAGSLPPLTTMSGDQPADDVTWEQVYAHPMGRLIAIAIFNNSTDQESVLALFDEAIAHAEATEACERTVLPVQAIMQKALAGVKTVAPLIEAAEAQP